ncbi:hypothetical protein [Hydrogenophaga sp.]|uniref:hypothetical protein n=1 Tax=Hydrogenophaga sp. TaxID=1904254 RepID=UPI00261BBDAC|nr:hypothetical protein [Hydrogenophaga sp.]MCW5655620.1 hypothetical protein [Hydrogenophaga sp.]
MFEPGFDQAAGLRAEAASASPCLMPVASPAQPARAYEWLCTLAGELTAQGRAVAVVDANASETPRAHPAPGLLQALQDPSVAGLEHASDGGDWLVMPGAQGLRALRETAHAAGAENALTRLLAPFAPGVLVLLFASAFDLADLLPGQRARALVPVLEQPQSSIDAYGSVKLLHGAGLAPVLAPLASGAPAALQTVVSTVAETAQRHLGFKPETWPAASWAQRVQAGAIERPRLASANDSRLGLGPSAWQAGRARAAQPLWS